MHGTTVCRVLRSPLFAAGTLLNALTLPPLLWLTRVPPQGETCSPAPIAARNAWTSGLEPIAFAACCAVVLMMLWASSRGGAQRPRRADLLAGALALVLGAHWWAAGEDSFTVYIAVFFSFVLYPVLVIAAAVYGWLLWAATSGRPLLAWRLLRLVCWCSIVVLIPSFVVLISDWGSGGFCMS